MEQKISPRQERFTQNILAADVKQRLFDSQIWRFNLVMEIDHITIIVSDIGASRQFYTNVLQMVEVDRPQFQFPGAWFELGNFQIHATLSRPESGLPGPGDRNSSVHSRGQHFAFRVRDFDSEIKRLKQWQIDFVDGPKKRPDGVSQVYFKDPDGYLIEICSIA
jgi:catechol 2,3-dioxygenase-like lactoylglutathione lyase family enzyme